MSLLDALSHRDVIGGNDLVNAIKQKLEQKNLSESVQQFQRCMNLDRDHVLAVVDSSSSSNGSSSFTNDCVLKSLCNDLACGGYYYEDRGRQESARQTRTTKHLSQKILILNEPNLDVSRGAIHHLVNNDLRNNHLRNEELSTLLEAAHTALDRILGKDESLGHYTEIISRGGKPTAAIIYPFFLCQAGNDRADVFGEDTTPEKRLVALRDALNTLQFRENTVQEVCGMIEGITLLAESEGDIDDLGTAAKLFCIRKDELINCFTADQHRTREGAISTYNIPRVCSIMKQRLLKNVVLPLMNTALMKKLNLPYLVHEKDLKIKHADLRVPGKLATALSEIRELTFIGVAGGYSSITGSITGGLSKSDGNSLDAYIGNLFEEQLQVLFSQNMIVNERELYRLEGITPHIHHGYAIGGSGVYASGVAGENVGLSSASNPSRAVDGTMTTALVHDMIFFLKSMEDRLTESEIGVYPVLGQESSPQSQSRSLQSRLSQGQEEPEDLLVTESERALKALGKLVHGDKLVFSDHYGEGRTGDDSGESGVRKSISDHIVPKRLLVGGSSPRRVNLDAAGEDASLRHQHFHITHYNRNVLYSLEEFCSLGDSRLPKTLEEILKYARSVTTQKLAEDPSRYLFGKLDEPVGQTLNTKKSVSGKSPTTNNNNYLYSSGGNPSPDAVDLRQSHPLSGWFDEDENSVKDKSKDKSGTNRTGKDKDRIGELLPAIDIKHIRHKTPGQAGCLVANFSAVIESVIGSTKVRYVRCVAVEKIFSGGNTVTGVMQNTGGSTASVYFKQTQTLNFLNLRANSFRYHLPIENLLEFSDLFYKNTQRSIANVTADTKTSFIRLLLEDLCDKVPRIPRLQPGGSGNPTPNLSPISSPSGRVISMGNSSMGNSNNPALLQPRLVLQARLPVENDDYAIGKSILFIKEDPEMRAVFCVLKDLALSSSKSTFAGLTSQAARQRLKDILTTESPKNSKTSVAIRRRSMEIMEAMDHSIGARANPSEGTAFDGLVVPDVHRIIDATGSVEYGNPDMNQNVVSEYADSDDTGDSNTEMPTLPSIPRNTEPSRKAPPKALQGRSGTERSGIDSADGTSQSPTSGLMVDYSPANVGTSQYSSPYSVSPSGAGGLREFRSGSPGVVSSLGYTANSDTSPGNANTSRTGTENLDTSPVAKIRAQIEKFGGSSGSKAMRMSSPTSGGPRSGSQYGGPRSASQYSPSCVKNQDVQSTIRSASQYSPIQYLPKNPSLQAKSGFSRPKGYSFSPSTSRKDDKSPTSKDNLSKTGDKSPRGGDMNPRVKDMITERESWKKDDEKDKKEDRDEKKEKKKDFRKDDREKKDKKEGDDKKKSRDVTPDDTSRGRDRNQTQSDYHQSSFPAKTGAIGGKKGGNDGRWGTPEGLKSKGPVPERKEKKDRDHKKGPSGKEEDDKKDKKNRDGDDKKEKKHKKEDRDDKKDKKDKDRDDKKEKKKEKKTVSIGGTTYNADPLQGKSVKIIDGKLQVTEPKPLGSSGNVTPASSIKNTSPSHSKTSVSPSKVSSGYPSSGTASAYPSSRGVSSNTPNGMPSQSSKNSSVSKGYSHSQSGYSETAKSSLVSDRGRYSESKGTAKSSLMSNRVSTSPSTVKGISRAMAPSKGLKSPARASAAKDEASKEEPGFLANLLGY